ncbi:MAG: hypothetical protein VKJ02_19785 [Snowella sp.]|nr:hypothetical protein [Snowella sp.]
MIEFYRKIPKFTVFLSIGIIYISAIANISSDINPILKNYLALVPLQFLALVYVAYFYRVRGKK